MPRSQLAIGDYGTIKHTKLPNVGFEAMARFRDMDGVTRRVRAQGTSKDAATQALKAKFRARQNLGGVVLDAESRVSELAHRYLASKEGDGLAGGTLYHLRGVLERVVVPRLGRLRIREVSPQVVEALVRSVAVESGPGAALNLRSALSGMFNTAARWGCVSVNPVGFVPPPKQKPREIRALTAVEVVAMRDYAVEKLRPRTPEERLARANGDTRRMGGGDPSNLVLDVMHVLLATGCRAGEAVGLAWEDVHLDDPVPWVEIRQQAVYTPGLGVRITQTKEGDVRRLRLRGPVLDMLRLRREVASGPVVFVSRSGELLNPGNVARDWRRTFKGSEWEWVTQKTLRKTVATLVSELHGSVLASKQLGHASDTMTKKHYVAQSLVPIDTGEALEIFGT